VPILEATGFGSLPRATAARLTSSPAPISGSPGEFVAISGQAAPARARCSTARALDRPLPAASARRPGVRRPERDELAGCETEAGFVFQFHHLLRELPRSRM